MMKKVWITLIPAIILLFILIIPSSDAKRLNHEVYYQEIICNSLNGEAEVTMVDNTRCDCLTEKYAIEVDFADKWTEGVGQALHYSKLTGKKAGVVLIVEEEDDMKYWDRLNAVIENFSLPIKTWIILP